MPARLPPMSRAYAPQRRGDLTEQHAQRSADAHEQQSETSKNAAGSTSAFSGGAVPLSPAP